MHATVVMDAETQNQDVPWALYSADLKVKDMIIRRQLPSLQFEIPIRPPLRFTPHGRPSPRINLQPVKDTEAFIVDKVVLPLEPFTQPGDPRQRRVYYIIAWPDLRAARPVVDAIKVLDYVSPRELEDWEYRDALRRFKEKELADAEAAAMRKAGETVPKKKPGRKPKNAMRAQIRPPTPELDSEEEEILARKKQGPSLSTPQKSRTVLLDSELELLDSEEASVGDVDADTQLLLENEAAHQGLEEVFEEDGGVLLLSELDDPISRSVGSSPPSRAGSGRSVPSSSHKGSSSVRPSPIPAASKAKSTSSHAQATLAKQMPTSSTPIPLPFQLPFSLQRKKVSPAQKAKNLSRNVSKSRSPKRSTPSSSKPPINSNTLKFDTTPSHSPAPESSGGFVPVNSFTPLGGSFSRPPKRPAEDSSDANANDTDRTEATPAPAHPKKERKKKQPKISQPPAEHESFVEAASAIEEEPEYVVKRLEGDDIVDGVHYFKVRWEGDWPPDQNPTWEPRDNIPNILVKKYLKRKAEKEAAKQPPKNKATKIKPTPEGKQQQTIAQWARSYASVSEAFEGKAELDHTSSQDNGLEKMDDQNIESARQGDNGTDANDIDELLIVDDSQDRDSGEIAADKARQRHARLAAQFASLTPGRRTQF